MGNEMAERERDEKGRYINGHKSNGGRKSKATEAEYSDVFKTVVTIERFAKQVEAQAKRADRGDILAFNSICKFLGLDVQQVKQTNEGNVTITLVYERRLPDHTP